MRGHCTNSVGKIQSKKRQIVISEVKVQNVHIRVIFFMVNAAKSLLDCYFGKWILKYSIHIMIKIGHFLKSIFAHCALLNDLNRILFRPVICHDGVKSEPLLNGRFVNNDTCEDSQDSESRAHVISHRTKSPLGFVDD